MGTIVGHRQVPVDDLALYTPNPRQGDIGAIVTSLEAHGQYRPVVVNKPTMQVLAGNHTVQAARHLGWDKVAVTFVDVDEEEARRIVLVDNRTNDLATYDDRVLVDLLTELADSDKKLAGTGFDGDDLDDLIASLESEPLYTNTVESPVYEPTEPAAPPVSELFNPSKTVELQAALETVDLPDDLRTFLMAAAERHTVLRFDRIAEYYAHADAEIQRLFEDSALVIVDFDQAIEQGFVRMDSQLSALFEDEYPNA